jgi:hypothetical protein
LDKNKGYYEQQRRRWKRIHKAAAHLQRVAVVLSGALIGSLLVGWCRR